MHMKSAKPVFLLFFFSWGGGLLNKCSVEKLLFIEKKTLSEQAFYYLNNFIPRKLHNFVNQPQTNHNYHC